MEEILPDEVPKAPINPEVIRHKVVIVGGGLSGLTLAHALEQANVDFVLLESHDFSSQVGAGIALWGNAIRMLEQLGLLEAVKQVGGTIPYTIIKYDDGEPVREGPFFPMITEQIGFPCVPTTRKELCEVLYSLIKDKSKLKSHTKFLSYDEDAEGVTVTCEGGEQFRGDLLVGADGVHSKVRVALFEKLEAGNNAEIKELIQKSRTDLACDFSITLGITDPITPITHASYTIYGLDRSIMAINWKENRFCYFLYERIPSVTLANTPRFTQEDCKKSLEAAADIPLGEGVTFRHLVDASTFTVKVCMEEYAYDFASSSRVCLLGDSSHKMTINEALGGGINIESAGVLANAINRFISRSNIPTASSQTEQIIQQFKSQREKRIREAARLSHLQANVQAGSNILGFRQAAAKLPWSVICSLYVRFHKEGPTIDFLPKPKHNGTTKYNDEV